MGGLFGGVERNRRLGEWRSPHAALEQSPSSLPGKANRLHALVRQAPGWVSQRCRVCTTRREGQERGRGKLDLSSGPEAALLLPCGLG